MKNQETVVLKFPDVPLVSYVKAKDDVDLEWYVVLCVWFAGAILGTQEWS